MCSTIILKKNKKIIVLFSKKNIYHDCRVHILSLTRLISSDNGMTFTGSGTHICGGVSDVAPAIIRSFKQKGGSGLKIVLNISAHSKNGLKFLSSLSPTNLSYSSHLQL